MSNWLKTNLNLTRFRLFTLLAGLVILVAVGAVVANSLRKASPPDPEFVFLDESAAAFESKQEFPLKVEQDGDTPLKILGASVKTISADQYRSLTDKTTDLTEIVSTPRISLQNVSDKVITGITIIINDQGANTNRGLYIHHQSINPGAVVTVQPDNFVRADGNPAKNPKFWLSTSDKSKVAVRVVAWFKDGSMWSNRNFGGGKKNER